MRGRTNVERYSLRLIWLIPLLLFVATSSTRAATVFAVANDSIISVGSFSTIELRLELDALEVASIFEGRFELVGLGLVATVALDSQGFGSTWASQFGGVSQSQLVVSLTSSNRSDHSLLATIEVFGTAPGLFELQLAPGTLLQRDTDTFPFFEDVPLSQAPGATLASLQIVPEPSTSLLVGLGLGSLSLFRRRQDAR